MYWACPLFLHTRFPHQARLVRHESPLLKARSPRICIAPGEYCAGTGEVLPRSYGATVPPRAVWASCRDGVIHRMAITVCSRNSCLWRRSVLAYLAGPTREFVLDCR